MQTHSIKGLQAPTARHLAIATRGVLWILLPLFLATGGSWAAAAIDTADDPVASSAALQVAFLAVDGVYNSELMAPYDIFHHTVFHTQPGMEVFVVSPDGEAVTSFEGLEIGAHYSFETAPAIDVLVVPSAEHSMDSDLEDRAMIDWVRKVGDAADYVLSLCDGAFVLAEAGLLDGRVSTTFPGDVTAYEQRFPELDVRRDVSFVHHGKAITAQGGAKSYDPAMYLVELLYGEEVARGVGNGMVIRWPEERAEHLVIDEGAPRGTDTIPTTPKGGTS